MFVAVALGIVFTATAFSWEVGSDCYVDFEDVTDSDGKVIKRIYHMHGPLFFASAQRFVTFFNPKTDPDLIEVNFMEQGAILDDFSAIHALNVVGEKYGKYDKKVVVRYLKFKSQKRAEKASKLIKSFSIETGDAARMNSNHSEPEQEPSVRTRKVVLVRLNLLTSLLKWKRARQLSRWSKHILKHFQLTKFIAKLWSVAIVLLKGNVQMGDFNTVKESAYIIVI